MDNIINKTTHVSLGQFDKTIYTGELVIAIEPPFSLRQITKLYTYLQTLPDLKILSTVKSIDGVVFIRVLLTEPTSLIGLISSKVAVLSVTPESVDSDFKKAYLHKLRRTKEKLTSISLSLVPD